jgi:hypothetical protein
VSGEAQSTRLDESAAIASIVFAISIALAYLSLRHNARFIAWYRDAADYLFLAGIVMLVATVGLFTFNVVF